MTIEQRLAADRDSMIRLLKGQTNFVAGPFWLVNLLRFQPGGAQEYKALVEAGRNILPYLEWTIGHESPGYHPTMPSAVAAFREPTLTRPVACPSLADAL